MVISFYRSITLAGMVALAVRLGVASQRWLFVRSLDRTDLMMGLALAIAFMTYVYAMLLTSVASALLLLTLSPFLCCRSGMDMDW